MIQFTKPTNLNGGELIAELQTAKIAIKGFPYLDGNNDLWLDIPAKDEDKAKAIVDAHNGTVDDSAKLTEKAAEKAALLNRLGLTEDELKTILG